MAKYRKKPIEIEAFRLGIDFIPDWFMANFQENEPNKAFEVKYGDCPYILQMIKREPINAWNRRAENGT